MSDDKVPNSQPAATQPVPVFLDTKYYISSKAIISTINACSELFTFEGRFYSFAQMQEKIAQAKTNKRTLHALYIALNKRDVRTSFVMLASKQVYFCLDSFHLYVISPLHSPQTYKPPRFKFHIHVENSTDSFKVWELILPIIIKHEFDTAKIADHEFVDYLDAAYWTSIKDTKHYDQKTFESVNESRLRAKQSTPITVFIPRHMEDIDKLSVFCREIAEVLYKHGFQPGKTATSDIAIAPFISARKDRDERNNYIDYIQDGASVTHVDPFLINLRFAVQYPLLFLLQKIIANTKFWKKHTHSFFYSLPQGLRDIKTHLESNNDTNATIDTIVSIAKQKTSESKETADSKYREPITSDLYAALTKMKTDPKQCEVELQQILAHILAHTKAEQAAQACLNRDPTYRLTRHVL